MPTIRKITDWQDIYRNVPAIVLEKGIAGGARVKKAGAKPEMGSPEQFYAEVIRQPSLAIEIPEYRKDDMEELRLIPLEYLYSLNSGILANA